MIAIIEIPDHYKNIPQDYYNLPDAVRHGKILPDNVTNGDVIKALYPTWTTNHLKFHMGKDWWNAPYTYKKEQKQEDKKSNKQYVSSDCGQCIYADGYNGWDDCYCIKRKTWLRANMLNCEYYKEQNND